MADFHAATYDLLGNKPETSAVASDKLDATEQRLGIRLPASFREWFSLTNAIRILDKYGNGDPPIPADRLKLAEFHGEPILPFRDENQCVCLWSLILDGTDDPPVIVDTHEGDPVVTAPSFSAYIYSCIWDHQFVLRMPHLVQANIKPLAPQVLAKLRRHFAAKAQTFGWPGDVQYRFAGEQFALLLWHSQDQTDWFVGARNLPAMEIVLRTIWNYDDVGPSFYGCGDSDEVNPLLEKLNDELSAQ